MGLLNVSPFPPSLLSRYSRYLFIFSHFHYPAYFEEKK